MFGYPVLSVLIATPAVGGLVLAILAASARKLKLQTLPAISKYIALFFSTAVLAGISCLFIYFDRTNPGFQFEEHYDWMPSLGISYRLGIDGISLPFMGLTALLVPICILASWRSIEKRVSEFMMVFLFLETMLLGIFCALDAVMFYVFFEGMLIPMFIIIGVWGGLNRGYAAMKFFLYTVAGSVLMLFALLFVYLQAGTADIPTLTELSLPFNIQMLIWAAFFASFAIKIPIWPLHTWLPDAHVEAPTAGSVILAGVLLKLGGYGFLRFSIPMLPQATEALAPVMYALGGIAVLYASFVALMQEDMKKLIAYSSIAHMGFVVLGIFSLNIQGIQGGMFQMISHGLISAALFLGVGVMYERTHNRMISLYGGTATLMPKFAVLFMLVTLAAIALPGTSGFVGEFLALLGVFQVNPVMAALAALGIILGAAYMLWLYKRVFFGQPPPAEIGVKLYDLTIREKLIFIPLVVIILLLGIHPSPLLDISKESVNALIEDYNNKLTPGSN